MLEKIFPYLIIASGGFVIALVVPAVHKQTIARLQQKNILPVLKLKPEKQELLVGAGRKLSLVLVGISLILLGIILIITV